MAAVVLPTPRFRSSCSSRPTTPVGRGLLPSRLPARRPPSATVRRRRAGAFWALAALGALLGAGSLAGAGQAAGRAGAPDGPAAAVHVAATTHVVQPGDTLWTIARRIQPEGDVRPLVARMRAEHGAGPLMPGQRLRLAV